MDCSYVLDEDDRILKSSKSARNPTMQCRFSSSQYSFWLSLVHSHFTSLSCQRWSSQLQSFWDMLLYIYMSTLRQLHMPEYQNIWESLPQRKSLHPAQSTTVCSPTYKNKKSFRWLWLLQNYFILFQHIWIISIHQTSCQCVSLSNNCHAHA